MDSDSLLDKLYILEADFIIGRHIRMHMEVCHISLSHLKIKDILGCPGTLNSAVFCFVLSVLSGLYVLSGLSVLSVLSDLSDLSQGTHKHSMDLSPSRFTPHIP